MMEKVKAIFKNAWPYQQDKMNLPVQDLEAALPFYTGMMGMEVLSKQEQPHRSAVLARDAVEIGLAENGGDPSQDGCFFEVDDIQHAFAELKQHGLEKELSGLSTQKHGNTDWQVFFVVAPDGLCYCLGQRQS